MLVVEGAGRPAEINLREGDIANMGFAEAVDCPVILVADIDRGGVFAQLVGTLELLSKSEQNRIIGFVINRFRGDIALLQGGLDWLEQRTGKPVFAVLPYLHQLYLDAEDAIDSQQMKSDAASEALNIVVPVLPRISNHTDFDALRLHPGVNLRFVDIQAAEQVRGADLVILPGSKNVRDDLSRLQQHNWPAALQRHVRYGGKLLGICGGYQMLGQQIADPEGIESTAGSSVGLGYLAVSTILKPTKTLARKQGRLSLGNGFYSVSGYEIHCGQTTLTNSNTPATPLIHFDNGVTDGLVSEDGQIIGTYLHGLFDDADACDALLRWAGLAPQKQGALNLHTVREQQLNRLADELEKALDVERLHAALTAFEQRSKTP